MAWSDEQCGQARCLKAQGSGRLPQSEHPSVPARQKSMGLWLWVSCQGVGCKYLHSSMHPPSPYPRIHSPNLPSGSSSAFSLGHLCWVEEPGGAVVWPRVLCLPPEAPCDLLWVKGRLLAEKTPCWCYWGHQLLSQRQQWSYELFGTAFDQHQSGLNLKRNLSQWFLFLPLHSWFFFFGCFF